MNGRRWKRTALVIVTLALLGLVFDRCRMICWVGSSDLEIEFAVTDANGIPIEKAQIEIESAGGFYEEDFEQDFVLSTDANGLARDICRNSMCFGTTSGFRLTDTFAVHLPFWRFRVLADGYKPIEWITLAELENRKAAHRTGNGKSKLVVPVTLIK